MASKPEDKDVEALVAKVRDQVISDTRIAERGFFVNDLQSSLKGFGPGDALWEISYKTTSAEAIQAGIKDKVAWEISYKTSSATAVVRQPGIK